MPVSGDEVETCPDCGCPQQEWRKRKHVSTCPRAVTQGRDADGLRRLIRACLRELDEEREAVGFAAEKVKWALDGEKMVRPDERDEGRVEKLEELLDALRSLLPETEGEA